MKFIKKNCPLCEKKTNTKNIYSKNLPKDLKDADYSGRKVPDNFHYKMIRCLDCGLLFAEEIYDTETITNLYEDSNFDYSDELKGLEKTYTSLFKFINDNNINKNKFLDIGCANGFLIKKAKEFGFDEVYGSEISLKAINAAHNSIKNNILQGPFDGKNYEQNSFDVIFFAMIIEHFENPNNFLKDVYKILKPGGLLIGIAHDEKHILAKILKNKHPIINDEHVIVFDKSTLTKIMIKNKFSVVKIENLKNYYSLQYWFRMMPIFDFFKNICLFIFKLCKLEKKLIGLKAGNIYIICKK
tara:strand:+ start:277 stop:1173 length:897 start_codon:yes stop_codon:yes gene_type:complete